MFQVKEIILQSAGISKVHASSMNKVLQKILGTSLSLSLNHQHEPLSISCHLWFDYLFNGSLFLVSYLWILCTDQYSEHFLLWSAFCSFSDVVNTHHFTDIYITIHNSRKITVMKQQCKNFIFRGYHNIRLVLKGFSVRKVESHFSRTIEQKQMNISHVSQSA